MGLITFQECKAEVSETADACPKCGRVHPGVTKEELDTTQNADNTFGVIGVLIVVGLFLYGFFKTGTFLN